MFTVIESCIIHGSDHWFIKPSVWNEIELEFKKKILDSINDEKFCIADEFRMTILNNLKQNYFDLADKQLNIPIDVAQLIAVEKEKSTMK
jgi:hypothetical protein